MKIAVFGIGYVGAVAAACLARDGHDVRAVDVSAVKVETLNAGRSPVLEPGLNALIADSVAAGRLCATTDARAAVAACDLILVCVGTPSRQDGSLGTVYLERVAQEIGEGLRAATGFRSVVFRSTMLPGTMAGLVRPILERASGMTAGEGFGLAYYPEFLRESTAIEDNDNPGAVVFGRLDDVTIDRLRALQPKLSVEPQILTIGEAEAVKYVNNAWHAVKISFANEIGGLCAGLALDPHRVMEVLCADTRLNMSPAYLRPGFAFGGSCLPKDLRALQSKAWEMDVATPILDAVLRLNAAQIDRAFALVEQAGSRQVSLFGLSFKAGGDDLRESPFVLLAERLIGRGYDLRIYDPAIRLSRLTGSNLAYVSQQLPHLACLLGEEIGPVIDHGATLILAEGASGGAVLDADVQGKTVIDLVRVRPELRTEAGYRGLCW